MSKKLKAIDTYWLGYAFRSRLEARWAIFFTRMGIAFQYELEGWILPNGVRYLPDFYLPHIQTWAEVKPAQLSAEELERCRQLALGSGQCVLLLIGVPDFVDYEGLMAVHLYDPPEIIVESTTFRLDIHGSGAKPKWYWDEKRLYGCPGDEISERWCSDEYRDAVYAARGERFDGRERTSLGFEPFNAPDGDLGL
jgi:hypothetical protein